MALLMVFAQMPAGSLRGATFYWAVDDGFGGVLPNFGGDWDTFGLNWYPDRTYDSLDVTSWNNLGNHTAVFGDPSFGPGPSGISIAAPITVGAIRFEADGVGIEGVTSTDRLTFGGVTPSITVVGDGFTPNVVSTINAGLAGTNGLSLVYDATNANSGDRGTVVLGGAGTGFSSALTGGINVGSRMTLALDTNSSQLAAGRNVLGNNTITLQNGAVFDVRGISATTGGLSGRLFTTNGTANSSRVDFSQTATGATARPRSSQARLVSR